MKIPFTLDAWLKDKSRKVETRDGRLVHNIWRIKEPSYTNNRKAEVCALIDGEEDALVFFEGGRYLPTTKDTDNPFDLFIITPESELSEFEDKLRQICEDAVRESQLFPERTSEDFAKKHSEELLALARKEPCEQIVDHIKKAYENGKAEALKDLPKWRKCAPSDTDDSTPPAWIVRFDVEREGNESKIVHNGYYIDFGSLERLPGFNE